MSNLSKQDQAALVEAYEECQDIINVLGQTMAQLERLSLTAEHPNALTIADCRDIIIDAPFADPMVAYMQLGRLLRRLEYADPNILLARLQASKKESIAFDPAEAEVTERPIGGMTGEQLERLTSRTIQRMSKAKSTLGLMNARNAYIAAMKAGDEEIMSDDPVIGYEKQRWADGVTK